MVEIITKCAFPSNVTEYVYTENKTVKWMPVITINKTNRPPIFRRLKVIEKIKKNIKYVILANRELVRQSKLSAALCTNQAWHLQ